MCAKGSLDHSTNDWRTAHYGSSGWLGENISMGYSDVRTVLSKFSKSVFMNDKKFFVNHAVIRRISGPINLSSSQTVEGWYTEELPCYNFATNSESGCSSGHMTQIIWKSSKKLGCGYAACNGSNYWSCNFDPGGNMHGGGMFDKNIAAPISPAPSCALAQ